jgi:hypothetical protein
MAPTRSFHETAELPLSGKFSFPRVFERRASKRSLNRFRLFPGRSGSIFGAVSMKPIIFVENTMSSKHGIFSENAGSRAFCDMFTAVLSFVYTP